MKRGVYTTLAMCAVAAMVGCGGLNPMGGGGGGAWKPTECFNTQFTGDLSGAKVGQWMTYAGEAGGAKTSTTVKVVGQEGSNWWVEWWMDAGSMTYGHLFCVGADKKISKAYAAAKGDKEWTSIKVNEPPTAKGGETPKAQIKESDEKKSVKAGEFACHRVDATVNISGKDYTSASWFSKDVWKLHIGSEHGGLVAMEASGMKSWLDSKGEDGKATMELPKK